MTASRANLDSFPPMSVLTRKYPFPQSKNWIGDCLVYSTIVFLILYFLQPFGLSSYQVNTLLVALIFAGVTFVGSAIYAFLVFNTLQRRIQPWKIWHHALTLIGMVLFIGISNFFTFSLVFHQPLSLEVFLLFIYWTFIIGVIITVLSIGLTYNRFLRNRMETLLDNTTEQQQDIMITLHDNSVRGHDLTLPINDLLYIEAQKNNVVVYHVSESTITSMELHATLSSVLDDLKDYPTIFQCHRSFAVNLNNITSAKGNSNGYQLLLGNCPTIVPVSRTYVPRLKSFIA